MVGLGRPMVGVEMHCSCVGVGAGGCVGTEASAPSSSGDAEELQALLSDAQHEEWTWDPEDKSQEVVLYGTGNRTALFHPGWSNGTAAVKGTKALNHSRAFWELQLSHRVFGTSIMFGVSAKATKNFRRFFTDLVGSDDLSWGLSHKGLLWHNGQSRVYTAPFKENTPCRIGVLFDGADGTLRFFKDGVDLGVAFSGLHRVLFPLFPIVASTAARSELKLTRVLRLGFPTLQFLSTVAVSEVTERGGLEALALPSHLKAWLRQREEALPSADDAAEPLQPSNSCPLEAKNSFF